MKTFSVITLILLLSGIVLPQDTPEPTSELNVQTQGASYPTPTITFRLQSLGTKYCWDGTVLEPIYPNPPDDWDVDITGNLICSTPGYNVRDCSANNTTYSTCTFGENGPLRLGLYKLTVRVNGMDRTYIYYDNRSSLFPGGCSGNDITVRYDVASNKVYAHKDVYLQQFLDDDWIIKKAEVINWWEMQECNSYDVSGFSVRYFPVLQSIISNCNANPVLTWLPPQAPGLEVLEYSVERSRDSSEFFQIYWSDNINQFTFTDDQITWGGNQGNTKTVKYRIQTWYLLGGLYLEDFSNIQTIRINPKVQKKAGETITSSYELFQNFPNPFNPVTNIQFSIPNREHAKLIVYDSFGREITTLINGLVNPGLQTIEFNGSKLASGVYYYRLVANYFIETKKFIFLK